MGKRSAVIARFWSKVDKKNGPTMPGMKTRCWIWTGSKLKGYGACVTFGGNQTAAHRFAWSLKRGPIPEGLLALHRCDNPSCVRDSHLFLGTHQDNMDDKVSKGRESHAGPLMGVAGSRNPRALLDEHKVKRIRQLHQTKNWSEKRIARRFGVCVGAIYNLLAGRSWSHVK